MDTQTLEIARSYDQVPYTSRPFPQSHPQRLAALGQMLGLTPPDVPHAKVLELGCAAGGNLIPLAASFPQSEFIGIDLSPIQIAGGQRRIARLGLKNIRLITMSIAELTRGLGTFDYILCHGVYSWVPADIRDAILRICHDNLSSNGIAYVSYNVFPGWRLRSVLRDAMLFHGEGGGDQERAARGREFLTQLSNLTNSSSPYGQMLRHEARSMVNYEDYYITHEYLESNNDPCYVADFFKRLNVFNLSFLTEADLHLTIAENFGAETGALLRNLSGNRLDRMEQYIDFLTGRTFRQTLLVRKEQEANIRRSLTSGLLNGLYMSTRVAPEPEQQDGRYVFKDAANRTIATASEHARDAISHLAAMFPLTATLDDLAAAPGNTNSAQDNKKPEIEQALFTMVLAGLADISSTPTVAHDNVTAHPSTTHLARSDARDGMSWTTNARHETVTLNLVERAILPMLDGSNDREALSASIEKLVEAGQLTFHRDGQTLTDDAAILAAIEEHIDSALASFKRTALIAS